MRILTRRMVRDQWRFDTPRFAINEDGVGHAVYTVRCPHRAYSLIAFAHHLPDSQRSDRVIAEAWDSTFCLFDGVPDKHDIERLQANVPLQEAGRISEQELTLSRANRSVRLWEHVVDALSKGRQPDTELVNSVGYLMRTTAVYGSGKFGAADRQTISDRDEFQAPFQPEMLTVYLIRAFVRDLVEHSAKVKGGSHAVKLSSEIAQSLGIGNSTGLGMAPFIVNHPILFNNWLMAREEAISRVRSVATATAAETNIFKDVIQSMTVLVSRWQSSHPVQQKKIKELTRDMQELHGYIDAGNLSIDQPWNSIICWSENALSEEGQELLASVILEPYGELVDPLEQCMSDCFSDTFQIDGSMRVQQVSELLKRDFEWATTLEWDAKENCARAWYVSEEKQEPRLGERFEEHIADYEQPLAPARDAVNTLAVLKGFDDNQPIAEFLLQHPEHRQSVRRAQLAEFSPYSEIRDNTISAKLMPIDMLRAKLSFFGATNFDPRSDRWVRICMYAGAPYPSELGVNTADQWAYPDINSGNRQ